MAVVMTDTHTRKRKNKNVQQTSRRQTKSVAVVRADLRLFGCFLAGSAGWIRWFRRLSGGCDSVWGEAWLLICISTSFSAAASRGFSIWASMWETPRRRRKTTTTKKSSTTFLFHTSLRCLLARLVGTVKEKEGKRTSKNTENVCPVLKRERCSIFRAPVSRRHEKQQKGNNGLRKGEKKKNTHRNAREGTDACSKSSEHKQHTHTHTHTHTHKHTGKKRIQSGRNRVSWGALIKTLIFSFVCRCAVYALRCEERNTQDRCTLGTAAAANKHSEHRWHGEKHNKQKNTHTHTHTHTQRSTFQTRGQR